MISLTFPGAATGSILSGPHPGVTVGLGDIRMALGICLTVMSEGLLPGTRVEVKVAAESCGTQ